MAREGKDKGKGGNKDGKRSDKGMKRKRIYKKRTGKREREVKGDDKRLQKQEVSGKETKVR